MYVKNNPMSTVEIQSDLYVTYRTRESAIVGGTIDKHVYNYLFRLILLLHPLRTVTLRRGVWLLFVALTRTNGTYCINIFTSKFNTYLLID